MRTVQEAKIRNASVLLIADYNVAIDNGKVVSSFKIDQTLETIRFIFDQSPKFLFILTHLGRPENQEEYSVRPIFEYLETVLPDIKQIKVVDFDSSKNGLFFGDNSRYYTKEKLSEFYKLFDVIVNDAFGCAHRSLNCKAYSGFLMQKEISVLKDTESCDLLIIGGAKAKDKIGLVKRFNSITFLAGLLAVDFLRGMGYEMGIGRNTINDEDLKERYESTGKDKIYLPIDFLVITKDLKYESKRFTEIGSTDTVIDIGEESVLLIESLIKKAKLILWNGPLGKFEDNKAESTKKVIKTLSESSRKVVLGGGETLTAVEEFSSNDKFFHVSTGGGAMLSYLSGDHMPGIDSVN